MSFFISQLNKQSLQSHIGFIRQYKSQTQKILSKQCLDIRRKIIIRRNSICQNIIYLGGYGYVWKAYNAQDKDQIYAVKRIVCQVEYDLIKLQKQMQKKQLTLQRGNQKYQQIISKAIINIKANFIIINHPIQQIQYKLPQHENLIRFIDGDILKEDEHTSQAVFLMEYCPDGTLFDLMESKQKTGGLSEQEILDITLQICKGLQTLHSINMTHRDLKIENVLRKEGKFKLCDFGSASVDIVDLSIYKYTYLKQEQNKFYSFENSQIDRKSLSEQEELFERYTTLQSRPPEMCDVYCGEVVNQKVDIWMLGCIVYCMCFYIHPFYEASKVAIVSASFKFKQNSKYDEKMHDFIRHLLTPSPKHRPDITQVISILENWQNLKEIPLNNHNHKIKIYTQKAQAKQTKENERLFEEDMKQRDIRVQQMIEKNRQERKEQQIQAQKQQQQQQQQNQTINSQSQQQQQQQVQTKNHKAAEYFDDGWGEFQKGEDNNQKQEEDEIDFSSFQPTQQQSTVDKNNFDFSSFKN